MSPNDQPTRTASTWSDGSHSTTGSRTWKAFCPSTGDKREVDLWHLKYAAARHAVRWEPRLLRASLHEHDEGDVTGLSSATSHTPWRRRHPSTSPVHCC